MQIYFLRMAALVFCCFTFPALAQKGIPAKPVVSITHTTNYLQIQEFSNDLIARLKAPPGWKVTVAAKGLGKPRMLYTGVNGELYVTRRDAGDVLMLKDGNGDGTMDELLCVVADFKGVHGITIHNGWLYLCNSHELKRYPLQPDGTVGAEQALINDMPDGGQHPNRTMEFGADGMLYISVGSLCNDCAGNDKEVATMLQVDTITWKRTIFASGLRNTVGFDFHPTSGVCWGVDNGGDAKGDDWPPEELNKIVKGADYAWPYAYGKQVVDETREDPPGNTKALLVKNTQPSVLEFTAHSAPIAFRFFKNAAGNLQQGDALVTWHGSWDRSTPSGFKVQLIHFANGSATSAEDFLTGFIDTTNRTRFGRPTGLAIASTGKVYISDDASGVIYCITPTK